MNKETLGYDKASDDGDWNCEVEGYRDENGVLHVTDSYLWRDLPSEE